MNENGKPPESGWIRSALDRFEGDLLRYARRILGDADRAEDVVQDTFLKLCNEQPESLNGKLAPWLYTVCRNRSLDVRRKEQRMTTIVDGQLTVETGANDNPAIQLERTEAAESVLRFVDQLPENQREVIRLKFQSGLKYREIAQVTGLSTSNVGFLIHSAIATLRQKMSKHSADGV